MQVTFIEGFRSKIGCAKVVEKKALARKPVFGVGVKISKSCAMRNPEKDLKTEVATQRQQ